MAFASSKSCLNRQKTKWVKGVSESTPVMTSPQNAEDQKNILQSSQCEKVQDDRYTNCFYIFKRVFLSVTSVTCGI